MIKDFAAFSAAREAGLAKLLPSRPRISVGMGTCGSGNGSEAVYSAFSSEIDARGLAVALAPVGCFGFCAEEPLVNVWVPGRPLLMLHRVQPNHVDGILNGLGDGRLPPAEIVLCKIEEWDHLTGHVKYGSGYPDVPNWNEVPFFNGQVKIVLRNCGLINPDDIEEYIAVGGYQALYKVLIDQNPAAVIEQAAPGI
jgi:NADH-quinone oxidoreductase subunit F